MTTIQAVLSHIPAVSSVDISVARAHLQFHHNTFYIDLYQPRILQIVKGYQGVHDDLSH